MTNYLNALRHVNLYLGHGVAVMENQESKLLKREVHKHLGSNQFRKEVISVQMTVQLVNCLDEHIPLLSCMKALFLVASFPFCTSPICYIVPVMGKVCIEGILM